MSRENLVEGVFGWYVYGYGVLVVLDGKSVLLGISEYGAGLGSPMDMTWVYGVVGDGNKGKLR